MSPPEATATVTIINKLGMHARPAMSFVELASEYQADVMLCRTEGDFTEPVDGKSIMQLMMLAATKGTALKITTRGEDAQQACDALCDFVRNGFDEA